MIYQNFINYISNTADLPQSNPVIKIMHKKSPFIGLKIQAKIVIVLNKKCQELIINDTCQS